MRWFEVENTSPVTFELERTGDAGPGRITLPARSSTLVRLTTPLDADSIELAYTVNNALVAPGKGLPVRTEIDLK